MSDTILHGTCHLNQNRNMTLIIQHAIRHLCALARTTPSIFIFMGGEGCHHIGSLRPNQYLLPLKELLPLLFSIPRHTEGTIC